MAILTPAQLQSSNASTYTTNGTNSITGANARNFNVDFISSSITVSQTGSMSVASAATASYLNRLIQDVQVTGSLEVSGAVFINNNVLQVTGPGVTPGVNYGGNTLVQIAGTEAAAFDIFLTSGGDSIHVETISGSGTLFQDINGQTFGNETWLTIPSNVAGNNPAPQMPRGLQTSGSLTITGSAYGNVVAVTVASNTASINLAAGNFFTVTLANSATTFFNVTNPKPGVSANLILTTGTVSTASFSSNVKQPSGSAYLPTSGSGQIDALSLVAVDSSNVYLVASKKFI